VEEKMPFCKNCGASVSGAFCPQCGTPAAAPTAPAGGAYTPPAAPPQAPAANYGAAPQPAPAAAGLTDNVAAMLCYVPALISGIIFLVLEPYKNNKFIRFHAFQSIFFGAAVIAIEIVLGIIRSIVFSTISFSVWGLWVLITQLVWLGFFAIWVFLLIKAYQGQKFKLPVIGDLAEKQA
jgi:uncharacterized membrane protein